MNKENIVSMSANELASNVEANRDNGSVGTQSLEWEGHVQDFDGTMPEDWETRVLGAMLWNPNIPQPEVKYDSSTPRNIPVALEFDTEDIPGTVDSSPGKLEVDFDFMNQLEGGSAIRSTYDDAVKDIQAAQNWAKKSMDDRLRFSSESISDGVAGKPGAEDYSAEDLIKMDSEDLFELATDKDRYKRYGDALPSVGPNGQITAAQHNRPFAERTGDFNEDFDFIMTGDEEVPGIYTVQMLNHALTADSPTYNEDGSIETPFTRNRKIWPMIVEDNKVMSEEQALKRVGVPEPVENGEEFTPEDYIEHVMYDHPAIFTFPVTEENMEFHDGTPASQAATHLDPDDEQVLLAYDHTDPSYNITPGEALEQGHFVATYQFEDDEGDFQKRRVTVNVPEGEEEEKALEWTDYQNGTIWFYEMPQVGRGVWESRINPSGNKVNPKTEEENWVATGAIDTALAENYGAFMQAAADAGIYNPEDAREIWDQVEDVGAENVQELQDYVNNLQEYNAIEDGLQPTSNDTARYTQAAESLLEQGTERGTPATWNQIREAL